MESRKESLSTPLHCLPLPDLSISHVECSHWLLEHMRAAPVVGAGMSIWVCTFSVSSLESQEIVTDVVGEYNIPVTISKVGEMHQFMLCYQYISLSSIPLLQPLNF